MTTHPTVDTELEQNTNSKKGHAEALASESEIVLFLDKDIYNFYLLLREREDYHHLSSQERFKVKFLVALSLFIQLGAAILLFIIDYNLNDMTETTINCNNPNNIQYNDCVITENKYDVIYENKMDFINYFARILAIMLIVCYMYPNITSIPINSIKLLQTKSPSWFLLTVFQIILLTVVMSQVTQMVYKSTSILEVLSSGIGFIIILEVDSYLYDTAYAIRYDNFYSNSLFQVHLNSMDIDKTIYSKFNKDTYDVILLCTVLFAGLFATIIACSWYSFGYNDDDNPNDALFYGLIYAGIAVGVTIVSAPCLFVLWAICTKHDAQIHHTLIRSIF